MIELKGKIKVLEESQEEIDKLRQDKKIVQEKNKKLEKEKENFEAKNELLAKELAGLNLSLAGRLAKGDKITLH